MLVAERDRTESHLFDLEDDENPEVQREKAWLDHLLNRVNELGRELDKIDNPQKYSPANVPHESLDDLDRQTE